MAISNETGAATASVLRSCERTWDSAPQTRSLNKLPRSSSYRAHVLQPTAKMQTEDFRSLRDYLDKFESI